MLQIKKISKQYQTGELLQKALDEVSLNLRSNEFVAVLGPSGSGKTTLLNLIGGLDRYDSGELLINSISTKNYKDRDWDSYRNHRVGFVFQTYNLIQHQSLLVNVELALTISGISKSERRKRAKQALTEVGLGDQVHKRPNQLSGGQMQRVAIARALVNDPEILLADEPTGALDSETGVQVLDLLEEVAKDRLVVMVTHNAELAKKYATRIVKLRDGKVVSDSNPYEIEENKFAKFETNEKRQPPKQAKNISQAKKEEDQIKTKKSAMNFFTALGLSFNNLWEKKGRTILTAFAGSIGIIGIALILSLSTGVNNYIIDIQKETMTSYPLTVEDVTMDMTSFFEIAEDQRKQGNKEHSEDRIYLNSLDLELSSGFTSNIKENNLEDFKKYLENPDSEIHEYVGEAGIKYSYATKFQVFSHDPNQELVNTDGSTFSDYLPNQGQQMYSVEGANTVQYNNFTELLSSNDGQDLISPLILDNYQLLYGDWPEKADEVILVLSQDNELMASTLYNLGIMPASEYKETLQAIVAGEDVEIEDQSFEFSDILEQTFYVYPEAELYEELDNGIFTYIGDDYSIVESRLADAVELKISGIIKPNSDLEVPFIHQPIGYTSALTDLLIDQTEASAIVKQQRAEPEINVLVGLPFEETVPASNLETNLSAFGVVSYDQPQTINIYVDSFEAKEGINDSISNYNQKMDEADKITYNDYIGFMLSSITGIVNVITYILIAFVAVSLIVSSIMIGIITYISVLERTKEIGILRAIGASRRNIAQVFNAETFIIGLTSGIIGVGITSLLLIPANSLIYRLTGISGVSAELPFNATIVLVLLSVGLTLLGGLIPSQKAAKMDPVTALRSD